MDRAEELAHVSGLRRGDARAFSAVFEALRPRIFAFTLRLSRRRETAEDLTQEAFVRLAKAAPTLASDTRLLALLLTIARNLFRSQRRWEMLDLSRLFLFGSEHDEAVRAHDERAHAARELRDLEIAMGTLSVAHREVLLLVGVEGLEPEAAAQVLGIEGDALRQRLSRARRALSEELAKREKRGVRRGVQRPQGDLP